MLLIFLNVQHFMFHLLIQANENSEEEVLKEKLLWIKIVGWY